MAKVDQFDSALDLLRRLPPTRTVTHLKSITTLIPAHEEALLASVDTPLTIARDPKNNREYLLCDYNRDGDSYRSPWSNTFYPPIEDAEIPSERIRKMEIKLNDGVDVYRELYFDGGVGSAYLWELEDGFAGVVLLKKDKKSNGTSKVDETEETRGGWDSIHVLEVVERGPGSRVARYKLTSTVILELGVKGQKVGDVELSGNMTRQTEQELNVEGGDDGHVINIGKLVEDMESSMRSLLQEVYFGKAKDIVGELRSIQRISETNKEREQQKQVLSSMHKP